MQRARTKLPIRIDFFPRSICLTALAAGLAGALIPSAAAQWSQWGGPHGDFTADSKGLASEWPADGPKRLWKRDLGGGYSSIVVDGDRLFTMYRDGENEVLTALAADTGKTLWEYKYAAPVEGTEYARDFGLGPNATPLVIGDCVIGVGFTGIANGVDKTTGEHRWTLDLWKDLKGNFLQFGYSSSPIAYKDTAIFLVGGRGMSIIAVNAKTGAMAWGDNSFENSYGSPRIINVDGQDQLVAPMAREVVGVDPASGELLWKVDHENQWHQNVCPPVWGPDNVLYVTSEEVGSKGLKLTRKDGKTEVTELWRTRKMNVHHTNAIRVGDYIYACAGRPAMFTALDVKTGEPAWKERGFGKSNCLYVDGKFIVLDEDGTLGLVDVSATGMKVLAKAEVLDRVAWTVPTLSGTTLYLRDKKQIVAVDLKGVEQ